MGPAPPPRHLLDRATSSGPSAASSPPGTSTAASPTTPTCPPPELRPAGTPGHTGSMDRHPSVARDVWRRLEPIHAVTYFAAEALGRPRRRRLPRLLDGLLRRPRRTARRRSAPTSWARCSTTSPRPASPGRCPTRGRSPRPTSPSTPAGPGPWPPCAGRSADADGPTSRRPPSWRRERAQAAPPDGRALFAANAALDWPDDPLDVLWHAATLLREHRGDGHVALLDRGRV